MSSKNDGGPAFPRPEAWRPGDHDGLSDYGDCGMSLRDWFAGQALAGLLAATHPDEAMACDSTERYAPDTLAEFTAGVAYQYGDAMLAERERGREAPGREGRSHQHLELARDRRTVKGDEPC